MKMKIQIIILLLAVFLVSGIAGCTTGPIPNDVLLRDVLNGDSAIPPEEAGLIKQWALSCDADSDCTIVIGGEPCPSYVAINSDYQEEWEEMVKDLSEIENQIPPDVVCGVMKSIEEYSVKCIQNQCILRYGQIGKDKYCESDSDCATSCGDAIGRGDCWNKEYASSRNPPDFTCCSCEDCRPCVSCKCMGNECTSVKPDTSKNCC